MKKIFKIIAIILILGVLALFYSKINKISLIENIRQKIAQKEEIQNINDITTIDVTDLEDNTNIEHEHIYKTNYDKNSHWEECTICNQKRNEQIHSYTSSWTMGSANDCNPKNVLRKVCTCGYIEETTEGRKAHSMRYDNNNGSYSGYSICKNCLQYTTNSHKCKNSNGIITCLNLGKCSICNYTYSSSTAIHYQYYYSDNELKENNRYCVICNTYIGQVNRCELIKETDNVYKLYTSMTAPSGAVYSSTTCYQYFGNNVSVSNSISRNGTTWNNVLTITFNGHNEATSFAGLKNTFTINGRHVDFHLATKEFNIDDKKPIISNITMDNKEELTEWSKTKPIIISGTENYCNTITIRITNEYGETIFEGGGNVSNNNYQVECIPEIECDTNGKTFTATITDNCGNSTQQEFKIAKVDTIAPTPTSGTEILGDWAKSKDFTFTATDYGIGQVQVAFNDIKDLQLAKVDENIFSRDYKFTGDVYKQKKLSVLYKDGLGNISIQKITIDKIDNTAPSITNATLHNSTITITSHDENETLGEGSGVVKYRYLASEEKLENPILTAENSTEVAKDKEIRINEIYKIKYIYLVAEDYVGNISKVYELKVPELKLTSTANPDTENGEGEIILDWSSYDIEDKYFVIYRKKQNQENWETIVPIEQKYIGNKYIDTYANDENSPDIPQLTITPNNEKNNINITANTIDNGNLYTYYIESYDAEIENLLLSKSFI